MTGSLRGVVALDGPSGTGKTTVARKLATQLGTAYLDTGATYRALTLAVLRAGVDPTDTRAVTELAGRADIDVGTDPVSPRVLLEGTEVGTEVRGADVTGAVSAVSAVPGVRDVLVAKQRALIERACLDVGGIVVEGRDIGTTVAPDAGLKVFLTASTEVRAQRRTGQDAAAGRDADPDGTLADVRRRDTFDSSRATSPLRAAEDATRLDTSELNIEQVLIAINELASRRGLLDDTTAEAAQ